MTATDPDSPDTARARILLSLCGGATAFALYELTERFVPSLATSLPAFLLLVFIWLAGAALLGLAGVMPLRAAALRALGIGLAGVILAAIAVQRQVTPLDFVDAFYGPALLALLVVAVLPVLLVWHRGGPWLPPSQALFDQGCAGVLRVAVAVALSGLLYGLLALGAVLLDLVGLDRPLEVLTEARGVFLVLGALTGLTLATASGLLSEGLPPLLMRLARITLPPVALVLAIFIAVLPINGLGATFGSVSAAATLMLCTGAGLALMRAALGTGEVPPWPLWSSRVLAVLLPLTALGAVIAVGLRVQQYGWTPPRLMAMTGALWLTLAALLQGLAHLRRDWPAALAKATRAAHLALIAVALAWLLPVLRPEAISVASQLPRLPAMPEDRERLLLLWSFAHDFGRTGAAAYDRLRDDPALAHLIARVDAATSEWQLYVPALTMTEDDRAQLITRLPVQPPGTDAAAALDLLADYLLGELRDSCARTTPAGTPGCLLVRTELNRHWPGPGLVLLRLTPEGDVLAEVFHPDGFYQDLRVLDATGQAAEGLLPVSVLTDLQAGRGLDATVTLPALAAGGFTLFVP